jgi:hypothetical protein
VSYKFLAGQLPPGIYVTSTGNLQGVPIVTDTTNVNRSYSFSIRASDSNGLVSDRSFTMTISNIVPPQITPRITALDEVFDGSYYSLQLDATEVNPSATLTWTLKNGSLPNGLSLSSSGLLSGFILPLPELGNSGQIGFGGAPYNEFGFDNAALYQNNIYQFTIEVFDGISRDQLTYTLKVIAKDHWEADSTFDTVDSSLTVDEDNRYLPIMITPSQSLPTVRSNSKFAFQFQAIDPNNNAIEYALSTGAESGFDQNETVGFDTTGFAQQNTSIPPGLNMDPTTGWLTGVIGAQIQSVQTYTFGVYAYEVANPTYVSDTVQYTMTILGDITNTITWDTQANLGIINNGSLSELSASATNHAGKPLTYSLVTNLSHLPQGLELQSSGLIVGRTTFEYFSLDSNTTTVDGGSCSFDNTYTFTVQATTVDNTSSSTQQFTILVNNYNKVPYENIYLKALLTIDQRQMFLDIVNNTSIFPPDLIYRETDPWFGRATDIRSLFIAGLNPASVTTLANAIQTNTYNKRIEFSGVKTAQALDENFNIKYEVVYIELADSETYLGQSPSNTDFDPIISANVYPNSFNNMTSVITNSVGYANQGALPDWMTSPQTNKKQLGFTRAIVLAYTVPGASELIAYRLNSSGIAFNVLNFVADRYDLDNTLTTNYNISTGKFISGQETTFDRIVRSGVGTIVATVDYGITGVAFDMINNKTVEQVQSIGGFDGITDFSNGDTLIFLQQENYLGETNPNDGWNDFDSVVPGWLSYIGSTPIANGTAGFPLNPVFGQITTVNNTTYIFTGEYDASGNLLDSVWKVANLRAGIWQINISNSNIVTLTPVTFNRIVTISPGATIQVPSTILPDDRVQINYGLSRIKSIVYYDPVLHLGESVPAYTLIPTTLSPSNNNTRFDNYGTKFINNRDLYETPESGDSYLKFPKMGEFQ